ncbi:MAG: GMP synthase [SAR86 cluster bacterium]|nr:GMP synthase [SAR86 cluster bacterium]
MTKKLTIGVLVADSVPDKLKIQFGDQAYWYRNLFKKIDQNIDLFFYDVYQNKFPINIDECDGYLITGSRNSVYDNEEWIHQLFNYVKELAIKNKPLVGVCFGHQMIAESLGGKTEKSSKGWTVGMQKVVLKEPERWGAKVINSVSLLHSHQDQVTKLPIGAEVVAGNKQVPFAIYKVGETIFSHQGHPEFSHEYAASVYKMRKEILGDKIYKEALNSIKEYQQDDLLLVNRWVEFYLKAQA